MGTRVLPNRLAVRLFQLISGNSVSLVAVSRLVSMFLTLLTAPLIARAIGPDGRGETATALAAFGIVPIVVGFGLPLELRRIIATQNVRSAIRASRDICFLLIFPCLIIALLLYVTIFSSMQLSVAIIASTGVALAPLCISWLCDQSVMIARENYRSVAYIQLAQPICYVGLIVIGFSVDVLTVQYVLIANICGMIVTFLVGLHVCRASFFGTRTRRRNLVRGGLKFAGSAIAETATNRLDQLLVLPLIGGFATGLYSVAVTISSIPLSIGHALGAHFFNVSAKSPVPDRAVSGASIRLGFIAAALCAIPICVVSPVVVPLIFGDEFSAAINLVLISQGGSVMMTSAYVGSMVLAGQGEGRRMLLAQVSSLAVGIPLLFILAPQFSAIGASIASVAGYFTLLVIVSISLGIGFRDLIPRLSDVRKIIVAMR
ncbi:MULTISPECIES: oligosaccharide flippase family protein [unclassified Rhodococcus (in: high G+C Gram-positive bacteria)]|uniref:oligosaccharide flippase family protein n=1 Tax=unclassified Rhodococcus (in: high G+C Gram-positive bacteria) TaxID=192944 RepID=UPI000AAD46F8|nr:oligosaccharide flippase family protein [Rhodococcus sp. ADH]